MLKLLNEVPYHLPIGYNHYLVSMGKLTPKKLKHVDGLAPWLTHTYILSPNRLLQHCATMARGKDLWNQARSFPGGEGGEKGDLRRKGGWRWPTTCGVHENGLSFWEGLGERDPSVLSARLLCRATHFGPTLVVHEHSNPPHQGGRMPLTTCMLARG